MQGMDLQKFFASDQAIFENRIGYGVTSIVLKAIKNKKELPQHKTVRTFGDFFCFRKSTQTVKPEQFAVKIARPTSRYLGVDPNTLKAVYEVRSDRDSEYLLKHESKFLTYLNQNEGHPNIINCLLLSSLEKEQFANENSFFNLKKLLILELKKERSFL